MVLFWIGGINTFWRPQWNSDHWSKFWSWTFAPAFEAERLLQQACALRCSKPASLQACKPAFSSKSIGVNCYDEKCSKIYWGLWWVIVWFCFMGSISGRWTPIFSHLKSEMLPSHLVLVVEKFCLFPQEHLALLRSFCLSISKGICICLFFWTVLSVCFLVCLYILLQPCSWVKNGSDFCFLCVPWLNLCLGLKICLWVLWSLVSC